MEYKKETDQEFSVEETKIVKRVYNVEELKFEIAQLQNRIAGLQMLLDEAVKVGIDIKEKAK